MKTQHLPRYRDIARLFFKYGRGDLVRDSWTDGASQSEIASATVSNGSGSAAVHERPGEILAQQLVVDAIQRNADGAQTALDVDPDFDNAAVPDSDAPQHGNPLDATARAAQLADDLEAMGPTFVKVGQFLSTRADLLPAEYLEALARLQDHVAPFSFAEVEKIITEELGLRLSKAFATFQEQPLAAASLGQVHRAELRDGRVVAVKVQRPDIQEQIKGDLEVLEEIAGFLDKHSEYGRRYDFTSMLGEFRKSLIRELDYCQEARNLSLLGEHLARFDRIVVPQPVPDYVTSRVLTMEFIDGRKVTSLGPLAKLEIDGAPLAEALCHAYLRQILVDGFFHADPHPGNIFVTADGRIAILDLGMVGQVAPGVQEDLLKLVLAISEGRGEDAGNTVVKLGRPLSDADPSIVRRQVSEMVLQFQGLRMKDIALGRLVFDAARVAAEAGYRMPRELTMLGKALLHVDQVARQLDPEFDPNAAVRRYASEIMRERMVKSLSPGKLFAGLLEMKELAENLPRRVNQLIDAIAENRVRIKVDAINEVLLMEGLQKIANRITLGLVVSAMIVGAALLMRIDTTFRILGYPGLAILFFLAAGVIAFFLIGNILVHDLRATKENVRAQEKKH
ncbi:MAG: AarF/ABC1/UbiB kinase family protein [Candidatus Eisenbacteria bacterium]